MSMRYVSMKERQKRGCIECIHKRMRSKGISCPYDRCPYRELDKYDSFDDFVQEIDCIVGMLLSDTGAHRKSDDKTRKARYNCRRVMVVETGETFNSIREAAKAYGTREGAISQVLREPTWQCCGYHWKYCDD